MSSARNHAKRSHRSEHFKRSSIGASARKMQIKKPMQEKRVGFFKKLSQLFRRDSNKSGG